MDAPLLDCTGAVAVAAAVAEFDVTASVLCFEAAGGTRSAAHVNVGGIGLSITHEMLSCMKCVSCHMFTVTSQVLQAQPHWQEKLYCSCLCCVQIRNQPSSTQVRIMILKIDGSIAY